ncbi:MAG TPA: PQQ-binding-like beta-propeller repeat protein [Methylomirabilota bacterium]|nr:PQQ-binding-like beta-propeller repeat protein [Methylomirabilota bacterium]
MTTLVRALVLATLINTAFATDWPQFRGPTHQGHSTDRNIPTEWGPDKNVAWKTEIPGGGWSSPSVVQGKVYLTTAIKEGDGLSLRALCLNAATGKILWNTEVFGPAEAQASYIHNKNSHASPTPLIENGKVYVHFGHQGTACLDTSGKVLWRQNKLRYPPVHGSGGSPVLVDGKLVYSADGGSDPFIVALDQNTGEVAWKVPRNTDAKSKFSFTTPLVIEVNGQTQIISPGSGVVSALNPKDGSEIWRARYGEGYSVIPRPVYGHGLLFIGTGYDRPTVLAVKADGKGDVTDTHIAWTLTRSAPNTPSMLLIGDELYMVSDAGIASCVDAKTGKVHWQERIGGNFSASPVFAEGRIYFQNEEGVGTVIKVGKTFEKIATNDLKERTLSSYAIADSAIYIRTAERLYKVGDRGIVF